MTYRIKTYVLENGITRPKIFHIDGYLSTGLTDCNGKEIFVGDTVKTIWGTGKVEFIDGAFLVGGYYLCSFDPSEIQILEG